MESTESTPASPKPRTRVPLKRWLLIAFVTALLTFLANQWAGRARPQLDLKNTGTLPLRVEVAGKSFVMEPAQTWHARFWPGSSLTIAAGEGTAGVSRTVTLEKRNVESGNPSRVAAEARLENGTNIVFEYTTPR